MLTSAAEDEKYVPVKAVSGLEGWIDCFEHAKLAGSVFARGVNEPGEIGSHKALSEAYEMGRSI